MSLVCGLSRHAGGDAYYRPVRWRRRIAIYYRDAVAFNMPDVTALAGAGGIESQNGTVFVQQQSAFAP
jgi:hypothetical protein